MKKLWIISLLILILIVPIAYSPPGISNTGVEGLQIKYPLIDFLKKGRGHDFQFHLHSGETGLSVTSLANCTFHLYNSSGNHMWTASNDVFSHTFDLEFKASASNFTNTGQYNYIVYCECTACAITTGYENLGGFAAVSFIVTNDGMPNNNQSPTNNAVIYFVLLLTLMLFFYPIFKPDFFGEPKKNEYFREMANMIIKRCMWALATFTMMLNIAMIATLAQGSGLLILHELFRYLWIFTWAGYIVLLWLLVGTVFDSLKLWRKNFELRRTGDDV